MSEQYTKLFALPKKLYLNNAPVLIAAGALFKNTETGKVLVRLKIQNIQDNTIKAATVKIVPLNTIGKPLGGEVEYQYLDLNAARDMDFGKKVPLLLPDPATRAFSVSIAEVIFTDNSIWTTTETREEALAIPAPLKQAFGDRELARQYKIEYGANCKYLYKKEKDLWWCACGALNHQDEPLCHRCQKKAADLAALDLEKLKADRDARLDAEQKKVAEEKAAAKVRAKKAIKIAMIAIVVIVAVVLISDNMKKSEDYNNAVVLTENGNYNEAIAIFEELGNYKDSKEQIEEIEYQIYISKLISKISSGDKFTSYNSEEFNEFIQCEATTESRKDGKYRVASALLNHDFYEEAIDVFASLENFRDSAEQKKQAEALLYDEAVKEYPTSPVPAHHWTMLLEKFKKISPDYQNTAQYIEELTSFIQILQSIDGTYYGSSYTMPDGNTHTPYFTIAGSNCETDKPQLDWYPTLGETKWDIVDEPLMWGVENGKFYGTTSLCDGWGGHIIKKIVPHGANSILVSDDVSRAGEKFDTGNNMYGGKYSTYDPIEEIYTKQ